MIAIKNITKNFKLVILITLSLIILFRFAYIWLSAIDSKPIKNLEKGNLDMVEITHRYKPIRINIYKEDPRMANLIKLTKKWWYFERFSPKSILYNHVAEYQIRFYSGNKHIEIFVFPKSELFNFLKEFH